MRSFHLVLIFVSFFVGLRSKTAKGKDERKNGTDSFSSPWKRPRSIATSLLHQLCAECDYIYRFFSLDLFLGRFSNQADIYVVSFVCSFQGGLLLPCLLSFTHCFFSVRLWPWPIATTFLPTFLFLIICLTIIIFLGSFFIGNIRRKNLKRNTRNYCVCHCILYINNHSRLKFAIWLIEKPKNPTIPLLKTSCVTRPAKFVST